MPTNLKTKIIPKYNDMSAYARADLEKSVKWDSV